MARRGTPEVNAGSMADIAFLLLIFFLVTTSIESDKGMTRKLPPKDDQQETEAIHKERNIFIVIINKDGELFVDDEEMDISNLQQAALDFIDNGGGAGSNGCSYCQGPQETQSSENPRKAVVSLQYDRQTKYGKYIAVQNEVMAAYNHLRNRVSNSEYGQNFSDLEKGLKDAKSDPEKERYKEQIKQIRKLYPLNISEAKPEKVN